MRIQYTHSSAAVIPHCCVPGTTGTVTKSMKRKTSPGSPFAKIEGMWVSQFFSPSPPQKTTGLPSYMQIPVQTPRPPIAGLY